jgi:pimeloyl-ACP methyl ester carboxylesterase
MTRLILAALLSGAAFLAPAVPAAAQATAPAFAPNRFSVVVEGEGPDVILIPGLATSREVWDGARTALRGRYRLHLVELAGFGGSAAGANASGEILPGVVEELSRYIQANRLQRPAVVGHSMGGFIGLLLARQHPEQVGRLMIVDSLPFIAVLFAPNPTAASIAPQAAAMRDLIRGRGKPSSAEVGAAQQAGMSATPEGQLQVGRWTWEAEPAVIAQAVYEVTTTDLRADLARIPTPITMLYPWQAGVLPEERARSLYESAYRAAPNARLVAIPESRHFIMVDQPELFANALRAFLER